MREFRIVLLMFILVHVIASCCDERENWAEEELVRLDTLVDSNPDSADCVLDSMSSFVNDLSRDVQMKYRLYRQAIDCKSYDTIHKPNSFFDVVEYFDEHGNVNEKMRAHLVLGYMYYDINDYPAALQCFCDGTDCADTLDVKLNYQILTYLWGHIAVVYHSQRLADDEFRARKNHIKYAYKANLIEDALVGTTCLIRPYILKHDTAMMIKHSIYAADLFRKHNFPKKVAAVYVRLVLIYVNRGEYDKAYKYIKEIEETSDLYDENHNITNGREYYNYALGLYRLGIHQLDSAEYHFRQLVLFGHKVEGYEGLMRLYREKGNVDSVMHYSILHEQAVDERMSENVADAVCNVKSKYEYSHYVSEARLANEKLKKVIFGCLALGLFIVFMICMLVWSIRRYKRKRNAMKVEFEAYRELKENEVHTLASQCRDLRSVANTYSIINDEAKFMNSELVKMICIKNEALTNAEWISLEKLVSECMPIFNHVISSVKLSDLERKVCILLRMGLTNSAIEILLNRSSSTVTNAKVKINRKLFNVASAYDLLHNIKEREQHCLPNVE